jgi:hypothetical protein
MRPRGLNDSGPSFEKDFFLPAQKIRLAPAPGGSAIRPRRARTSESSSAGGPPAHSSPGLLTESPSEGSERSGRRALSGPLSEGLLTESPSAAPSISTPLGGRVNATFSISLAHGLPAAAPHIRVTS